MELQIQKTKILLIFKRNHHSPIKFMSHNPKPPTKTPNETVREEWGPWRGNKTTLL